MHRDPIAPRRGPRRALVAGVIAAALAAATPASAQPRKEPASRTAPRASSTVPAVAPALAAPLPPPPSAAPARRAGWLSIAAGPWAGFSAGQGVAAIADYGFLKAPAFWSRLDLELHLSATLARPSKDTDLTITMPQPYGPPVTLSSGVEKATAWVVEVVPSARLRLPVGPTFALVGEGGLGLSQTVESSERDELFLGHTKTTRNQTSLVAHLGAGMVFDLSERTRLVFMPLALSLQLGTGFSAYVPTLGLAYRL